MERNISTEQLKLRHGDSLSHWHYNPTYCLFCCFWTLGMGVESIGCCVWLSQRRMLYQHRVPFLDFHYTISLDWVGSIIVSVLRHILFLTNNKCKKQHGCVDWETEQDAWKALSFLDRNDLQSKLIIEQENGSTDKKNVWKIENWLHTTYEASIFSWFWFFGSQQNHTDAERAAAGFLVHSTRYSCWSSYEMSTKRP